ncbi:MAG TPA: hypothetical protein VGF28_16845 [Thermoanaerobaculia bacterium]|jgi:protein tyrosine phosphatase (PTP) superfamily phosphohydrolase (DUF442 family)
MTISDTPPVCSIAAFNGCRLLGSKLYVTGQPSAAGYAQIAAAGVQWVLSVRNPNETAPPAPPFDVNEPQSLLNLNVLYANVPVTHGMPQAAFNQAATVAAVSMLSLLELGTALIHCSSGDRASAIVAVALIATGTASNADAAAFAEQNLLLSNPQIEGYVLAYQPPSWFNELLGPAAREQGKLLTV